MEKLEFKKIELCDVEKIRYYVGSTNYRLSDYTECLIYVWRNYLKTSYAIYDDTLFLKYDIDGDKYALPLGKLGGIKGMKTLIETYGKIEFISIPVEVKNLLEKDYILETNVDKTWSDYLYNASDLAYLVGKKYHRKKNKVNKFTKNNEDIKTEDISVLNLPSVIDFLTEYSKTRVKNSPIYLEEKVGSFEMLNHFESFNLKGMVLKVKDEIVAFTLAEIIGDTAFIHTEKANIQYDGAYETINLLFSRKLLEEFSIKYINREDDAGDSGLEFVKKSYLPCMIIEKFNIVIKDKIN